MGFGFLTEGRKTSERVGERWDKIKTDEKRPYQATNSSIGSRDSREARRRQARPRRLTCACADAYAHKKNICYFCCIRKLVIAQLIVEIIINGTERGGSDLSCGNI